MSRGDDQETAENGGQWQRTMHEVNRNDGKASPAPNLADRTSEMTTGDGPIPSSRTRPKNAVKHQHQSTRNIPLSNGRANANAQHSKGHPKPIIHLPKRHRPPLEGERDGVATNGCTHSSSGRSMPQKLAASSNESETLVIVSIESEDSGSGETFARIRLGGMSPRADDTNGPGRRTEMSKGQADESEGRTDESRARADASNTPNKAKTVVVSHRTGAGMYLSTGDAKRAVDETDGIGSHADASSGHRDTLNVSNDAETARLGFRDGAETYLGAADAKRDVDETDGLGGHADASNGHMDAQSVQTDALMPANALETVSIRPLELETPNSPPGSARECAEHPNGLGNRADTSSGCTDIQCVGTDAKTTTYVPQIVRMRPNGSKSPNLPAGSATSRSDATDGFGSHTDTSSACTHAYCVGNDTQAAANAPETVSIPRNESKPPNSPAEAAWQCSDKPNASGNTPDTSNGQADAPSVDMDAVRPANESKRVRTPPNGLKRPDSPVEAASQRSDEPNGCRDHTDASSAQMDAPSIQTGTSTPANGTEHVRTRRHGSKTQDSPHGRKIATPKCTYQWKRVSVGDGDVYLLQNTPIDRTGRIFVFGQAESAGEAVVARVVDETAGDGNGRRNGGDGDVNGTTSSGNVDSTQVEAALLATDSQQTRSCQITRKYDLPVSFWPPIQPADRPYGPARHKRRRGQLKIERINDKSVSQTLEVETAHLEHARAAQLPVQSAERPNGPARHRRRRGSLKIERINVSRTPKAEMTHLARAHATQPCGNPSKRFHRVHTPIRRHGIPTIEWINVSPTRNGETAYLRHDPIAQPRGDDPQRSYRVIGPRRRRGRLKLRPTNVSRTPEAEKTYQGLHKPILPLPRDAGDPSRSTHRISSIQPPELEGCPAKG